MSQGKRKITWQKPPALTFNDLQIIDKYKESHNIDITNPHEVIRLNPKRPVYSGQRTKRNGDVITDNLCMSALGMFYSGEALPLFTGDNLPKLDVDYAVIQKEKRIKPTVSFDSDNFEIVEIENETNSFPIVELSGDFDTGYCEFSIERPSIIESGSVIEMNSSIEIGSLYFVIIASSIRHAMIAVISNGKLYTIGYGHAGGSKPGLTHALETLGGAMYSADYLTPTIKQGCNIVWVGFLDDSMKNHINEEFKKVTKIRYNGEIEENTITLKNYAILESATNYSELASVFSVFGENCITWVNKIIGLNLNCGAIPTPNGCRGITAEEFNNIRDFYQSTKLTGVVLEIQSRLMMPQGRLGFGVKRRKRLTKKIKRTRKRLTKK